MVAAHAGLVVALLFAKTPGPCSGARRGQAARRSINLGGPCWDASLPPPHPLCPTTLTHSPSIPPTLPFAMFAQYSPLFTSGLRLSDNSPSSSRAPSPQPRDSQPKKQTHDSLPVTISTATFSLYAGVPADSADDAFFLTLKPSRRDVEEGRSFLSLDLAESHRSMSLRRKDTVTTTYGRSVPTSPVASIPSVL